MRDISPRLRGSRMVGTEVREDFSKKVVSKLHFEGQLRKCRKENN
jgi:hypothetical protein